MKKKKKKTLDLKKKKKKRLWDVVPEAAAALAAQPCKTPQELADRLVSLAYARNSDDNITCVVIDVRCSDPPPAAKHTLQLLEQNVAQLLKTLLSPNRGLAFRLKGRIFCFFPLFNHKESAFHCVHFAHLSS